MTMPGKESDDSFCENESCFLLGLVYLIPISDSSLITPKLKLLLLLLLIVPASTKQIRRHKRNSKLNITMLFLQPPLMMKSLMTWINQQQNDDDETSSLNPTAVFQFLQGGDHRPSATSKAMHHRLSSNDKVSPSRRLRLARRYDLMRDSPSLMETSNISDSDSDGSNGNGSSNTHIALFVSDETLDMTAVGAFQSMLCTNPNITELKLTNLQFETATVRQAFETALIRGLTSTATATAVVNKQQLVRLTVRNCQITDQTAMAVAEHILQSPCCQLNYLDLSDNPAIGDKGILALMHGIAKQQQQSQDDKSQSLESLSLNNVKLTENMCRKMLLSGIFSNSKLKHISLYSIHLLLPPQVWQDLAHALQDNFSLQSLVVGTFFMSPVHSSDESVALSLWCAPASTVEALEQIEYYLRRNRVIVTKDWLHYQAHPPAHQQHQQDTTSSLFPALLVAAVQHTNCLEKQCRSKQNSLQVFSETPLWSVNSESFALSLLFDLVRQNPQTVLKMP